MPMIAVQPPSLQEADRDDEDQEQPGDDDRSRSPSPSLPNSNGLAPSTISAISDAAITVASIELRPSSAQ